MQRHSMCLAITCISFRPTGRAGHLLQCRGANLHLQIQRQGDYRIALPETEDFLKAYLRRDPVAALAKAEGKKMSTHGSRSERDSYTTKRYARLQRVKMGQR